MKIVAFGEIMMRLTPPDYNQIADVNQFDACYGGTESNVLVALSHLGNQTSFISKVPNNGLGEGAIRHLMRHGVDVSQVIMDGSTLGLYFMEQGFGNKASRVIYHRKNSVVNTLIETDLNYNEIFEDVSWFHVTGITLAISENAKKVAIRLCSEAKKRGIKVSFDFNYRATLWSIAEAKKAYEEIMPYVDVCFGNEFDLNNMGIKEDTPSATILKFLSTYNVSYLVHTKRTIIDANQQSLKAFLYHIEAGKLKAIETLEEVFVVLDRIGGGDAFDAGVIHILNQNFYQIKDAIQLGLKCDILKHLVRGDVLSLSKNVISEWINSSNDVFR